MLLKRLLKNPSKANAYYTFFYNPFTPAKSLLIASNSVHGPILELLWDVDYREQFVDWIPDVMT